MKCPFCAEEIQDAAILCRFCGATRTDGAWRSPQDAVPTVARTKGTVTLRLAGAFFLISAAVEAFSLTGAVPLAGAMRTGLVAVAYHLAFTAMYVAMGLGLLMLRSWGFPVLLAGTGLYTIDCLAFLLDTAAIRASIGESTSQLQGLISGMEGMANLMEPSTMIVPAVRLETVAILACWWGFAFYVYAKRRRFGPQRSA